MATQPRQVVVTQLRQLRASRGVTQSQLAMRMGVAQPAISKLEQRPNPSVADVSAYVGALGGELFLIARFEDAEFSLQCFDEQPPASR